MDSANARKRPHDGKLGGDPFPGKQPKRRRQGGGQGEPVTHALLAQYYPRVIPLREYILSKLPSTSRIRRRKICRVGRTPIRPQPEIEVILCHLLDSTLVGAPDVPDSAPEGRWEEYVSFSQKGEVSYVTISDGLERAVFSQADIVDFVIWLLFSREKSSRPKHLLCDGFRQGAGATAQRQRDIRSTDPCIPGLFAAFPNHHVKALKERPWPQLLALLGWAGEHIMLDLLLDCAIFVPVEAGTGNLYQLSGAPMTDLELLSMRRAEVSERPASQKANSASTNDVKTPTSITFIRTRILYGRAAITASGNVESGFRHIHILNRALYLRSGTATDKRSPTSGEEKNEENTLKVMAYIFPRQFGLHNVFTSEVDRTKTSQKLQDYTLREDELSRAFSVKDSDSTKLSIRVPKRLRGEAKRLVERLQILHGRCSYMELLRHYCPVVTDPGSKSPAASQQSGKSGLVTAGNSSQPAPQGTSPPKKPRRKSQKAKRRKQAPLVTEGKSLVDLATPASQVSAFCRAVLSNIVPNEFWGAGDGQEANKAAVMKNVDRFIRLRRFESMTLHDAFQGVKIADVAWLAPPKLKNTRMSQTDTNKRLEIFYEFLYYVFDSLLIPLIRSNFYVTDSNKHKYRLFYFRHDIWRSIAEPAMAALKASMFEEVKLKDALLILDSRKLGFSNLRLLPKGSKLRPIMNLRRRAMTRGSKNVLGPSINSVLGPVHSVLSLEKELDPSRLGSAMFSVSDIYARVKKFSETLPAGPRTLYFAKVDVQGAFDTIPQAAVIDLMNSIPTELQYHISKHVEIKPADEGIKKGAKPSRKWRSLATSPRDHAPFARRLEKTLAATKRNTIFVDNAMKRGYDTKYLLALVSSHIEQNLVKIGKKYFRQKTGVPQGSVLSSLLCNYFYADLEKKHLDFLLQGSDTLLLRLIDDFLVITTEMDKAVRFLQVMHDGLPAYGVTINPSKSLTNFPITINNIPLAHLPAAQPFPYCGTLIHPTTLSLSKDRAQTISTPTKALLANSLTVDARLPGHNFIRKTLNAFKIQSHMMFYDTSHNTLRTARGNLRAAFEETARKTYVYVRCLPRDRKPTERLWVRAVGRLCEVAYGLLRSKMRRKRARGYECRLGRSEVAWECLRAFRGVVEGREGLGGVRRWIVGEMGRLESSGKVGKGERI